MSDWRMEFRPLPPEHQPSCPGEGYLVLTDGERECHPCESYRANYPDDLEEGDRKNLQRMLDDLNAGRWTWDSTYECDSIYAPDGREVRLNEVAERLTLLDMFLQRRRNFEAGNSVSWDENHPTYKAYEALLKRWL